MIENQQILALGLLDPRIPIIKKKIVWCKLIIKDQRNFLGRPMIIQVIKRDEVVPRRNSQDQ